MQKRFVFSCLILVAAFLCSACGGGGSSSSSTTGNLKLVNATQVSGLILTAGSTALTSGIASGAASSYASISTGSHSIFVSASDSSLATSATTSITISSDTNYTVVAYARGGQIKLLTITDSKSTPSTGFASVTTYNAGSDAGAVDVYVVTPGASITDLTPTFSDVVAAGTSLTNSVAAGTYDIVVTGYSKPSDVRLTIPSVTLTSTEIVNLALTSTTGGTLVDGALVQQGGAVQLQPATTARVRVVAAFPATTTNSVVATTVGGSSIGSVTAPSVGSYHLVAAGSTAYTLSVNGTAIASVPSATFASGGDYTIMVYGDDPASPSVSVFTDNNLIPSTGAKIRLVNGAVSNASLSLTDNYVNLFSELEYGKTSDYSGITAGSSYIQITSPVSTFTSYNTTVSILSSGVYTYFVLGGSNNNAIEVLSKDR